MNEKSIEEELKNHRTPTCGAEHLEQNKITISFDAEKIASTSTRDRVAREVVEKIQKEGRELTPEDWGEFAKKHQPNMEEVKKSSALHEFILSHRELLLKLLKEEPLKKKKIRHSGHFVDQKLKYTMPDKDPPLLDLISSETREKIASRNVEVRAEGIRLSPPQDKLVNAIMRLLHEKSEHRNERSDNFYSGNVENQLILYGGHGKKARAPVLRIFPSELYKAYLDSDDYSGKEIENIKSVLRDTEQQRFLLIYEKTYEITNEKGKKEKRTDRIEEFQALIQIVSFYEGLTDEERKEIDQGNEQVRERRGELVIALNPLFTDQINSKYVEYPEDINRKTVIAAGGSRLITESIISLRDYLMREISSKRSKCEINEDKLAYTLKLERYLKQRRKKRIQDNIDSAIRAAKNLGLITGFERTLGSLSQRKYVFHLNPKFE